MIGQRQRTYQALLGGSVLLLLCSLIVLQSNYVQITFSILAFILPLLVSAWFVLLLVHTLYSYKMRNPTWGKSVILSVSFLLMICLLWPQLWLFRSVESLDQVKERLKHETVISLMTWNLQRFGDLGKTSNQRMLLRKARLSCLKEVLDTTQKKINQSIDLFAFQEVSNHNLRYLEGHLGLKCQHIAYHNIQHTESGLGVCIGVDGPWKINYVRKIILSGKGRWRALFAEISHQAYQKTTFNLLNVHFLPHGIAAVDVRNAIFDVQSLFEIAKEIIDTSNAQYLQAEGLLSVIKHYQDPTLVVGDFNAPPHAGAHPLLSQSWDDVWKLVGTTFGATKYFGGLIPYRIDYVYALKDAFHLIEAKVFRSNSQCSDHKPLITTLGLVK